MCEITMLVACWFRGGHIRQWEKRCVNKYTHLSRTNQKRKLVAYSFFMRPSSGSKKKALLSSPPVFLFDLKSDPNNEYVGCLWNHREPFRACESHELKKMSREATHWRHWVLGSHAGASLKPINAQPDEPALMPSWLASVDCVCTVEFQNFLKG